MSTTLPGQVTVRLHRLTMVTEDGGVMVGRPETGSYALFPSEGAELLRRLEAGASIADGVRWYEQASGSALDVEDFLAVIEDLGFVRGENEDQAPAAPVRWRRLGIVVFSWPALAAYAAVIAAAIVAMIRDPSLRPSYRNLFFTDHPSLIPVVLTSVGISFVVVHEWCHMLAGLPARAPVPAPDRPAVLLPDRRDPARRPAQRAPAAAVPPVPGRDALRHRHPGGIHAARRRAARHRCRGLGPQAVPGPGVHQRAAPDLAVPVLPADRPVLRGRDRGALHPPPGRGPLPYRHARPPAGAAPGPPAQPRLVRPRPGRRALVRPAAARRATCSRPPA